MVKKRVNIIIDEETHDLFKNMAYTQGISFSGLVLLSVSEYAKSKGLTKSKVNDRVISNINIQIAKEKMRNDNFKAYLPNNTLETIKLQALNSLKFTHDLNMALIKNTIRNAHDIYKNYPKKNQRLIQKEMESLRGLIQKEDLWVFLKTKFPQDFQPFKRNVIDIETKKPIEFKGGVA